MAMAPSSVGEGELEERNNNCYRQLLQPVHIVIHVEIQTEIQIEVQIQIQIHIKIQIQTHGQAVESKVSWRKGTTIVTGSYSSQYTH